MRIAPHVDIFLLYSWGDLSFVSPYSAILILISLNSQIFCLDHLFYFQFLNFKVTVLGEVRNPGSYKVNSERISILDALGMAGDLQINAKRKNVLVMREDGNEKVFSRVDLTSSELLHSPFFYLQQNDVVYVEPSRGRIVGGNAGTFLPYILSSVSTFVAVLALIIR